MPERDARVLIQYLVVMARFHGCPVCFAAVLGSPPYANWRPTEPMPAPPYEETFGMPSYEVCTCCGFEFGNDDNPGTSQPVSFEEYRNAWVEDGRPLVSEGRVLPDGACCHLR